MKYTTGKCWVCSCRNYHLMISTFLILGTSALVSKFSVITYLNKVYQPTSPMSHDIYRIKYQMNTFSSDKVYPKILLAESSEISYINNLPHTVAPTSVRWGSPMDNKWYLIPPNLIFDQKRLSHNTWHHLRAGSGSHHLLPLQVFIHKTIKVQIHGPIGDLIGPAPFHKIRIMFVLIHGINTNTRDLTMELRILCRTSDNNSPRPQI